MCHQLLSMAYEVEYKVVHFDAEKDERSLLM